MICGLSCIYPFLSPLFIISFFFFFFLRCIHPHSFFILLLFARVCVCVCVSRPVDTQACNTDIICGSFAWHVEEWNQCDANCSGGFQNRVVQCINKNDPTKAAQLEYYCTKSAKPATQQACNTAACPVYQWYVGPLSVCTKSCADDGTGGTQVRLVECHNFATAGKSIKVEEAECLKEIDRLGPMPEAERECNTFSCPVYDWCGWALFQLSLLLSNVYALVYVFIFVLSSFLKGPLFLYSSVCLFVFFFLFLSFT